MQTVEYNGAVVGYECATGDLALNGNSLLSCVLDFTTLGLEPGIAVVVGDQDPATRFATLPNDGDCIAFVKSIPNPHRLELERCSWPAAIDAGAGRTIRLFFGQKLQANPGGALKFKR